MQRRKEKGFTLAEVLVTLTIIGVIAALTIPALIQDIQDAHYKTAYKEAYSVAQQAWSKAIGDSEVQYRANNSDAPSNDSNFNTFMAQFSVAKQCYNGNNPECWSRNGEQDRGYPQSDAYSFIDSAGRSWTMPCSPTSPCGCDFIWLDTNGLKGPNRYGKDRFEFYILNIDGSTGAGLPIKIKPLTDISNAGNNCPSGSCWNTSWLRQ